MDEVCGLGALMAAGWVALTLSRESRSVRPLILPRITRKLPLPKELARKLLRLMSKSTTAQPIQARFWMLKHPRAPWIFGIALTILALIQALHRARQGRCALLKWGHHFDTFFAGGELYGVGAEGYPTLPFSLVVMAPFDLAGDLVGPMLWAILKVALAWWIVTRAFRLVGQSGVPLAPVFALGVIAISFRPLLSDITHGNLNILVGATVASAAWSWHRGHAIAAGFWLGLGTVLKVTPALGLVWFLRKRSPRGAIGMGLGVLFALVLPALIVGWSRNIEYMGHWWHQMVTPYLGAERLDLLQTEHINQSMFGVLARYLTDSVAIPIGTLGLTENVSIHWVDLTLSQFHFVHRAGCVLVLAFLLWCSDGSRSPAKGSQILGEFCLLGLAMLFLSERSWKHHYVLLAFPMTFLVWHWRYSLRESSRKLAGSALLVATLLIACTGSGFLGKYASKLAEAHGAFLLGGLALFFATGVLLRRGRDGEAPQTTP
jgi:alpha-1,2-mannosyltransferase